nr:MAG TPA: protein of unknown function (DUF4332) [Caudoviricetes sp.]
MDAPTIRVIGFKVEYSMNKETGKRDRPVEWVEYAPTHAVMTSRIWGRVKDLMPPEVLDNDEDGKKIAFMQHRWAMIEPAYDAWKKGQELPLSGTPLSTWAGVTAEQAQALNRVGIRTVEEIAGLTDSHIGKVPLPNVRDLIAQAKAFLETADRNVVADKLAEQQGEIDVLKEQLAAAMELLEEQTKGKKTKADDKKTDEDAA